MSDDRFSYVHLDHDSVRHLAEDSFSFDLPDEDIDVPSHLVPLYQEEEDDSVLPTNSHPSYPYGNPYRVTSASKLASAFPTAHRSLATSLPSLYHSRLGANATTTWTDLGVDRFLPYQPPQEHVTAPSALPEDPGETARAPPPPPIVDGPEPPRTHTANEGTVREDQRAEPAAAMRETSSTPSAEL